MKKSVAMLTALLMGLMIFAACADHPVPPPSAPQAFRAVLSVQGEGYALQCDWEQSLPGSAVFRVTEPETLAGLTLTFTGTDCRAAYKGLATDVFLPAQSFFRELMEALSVYDELSYADKGGYIETQGRIRTGDFVIRQNELSGDYQSFMLPHGEAEILSSENGG
ncbi:MAG: hypothetical protein LBT21_06140 [Oscillospiraceae bacterium]|nr:hypothetical protein [Oscillospiraceae bacterium]